MLNTQNVALKMTAGRKDQFPRDGKVQIALSGRSNVGKSSLINTLLGRKSFARTSAQPGKTITINFYEVDKKLYLVDLPGYGYARRSADSRRVWASLTNDYLEAGTMQMVLQLIDLKVGPTEDDYMMIEWLNANKVPYVVVATKSDKLNTTTRNANFEALVSHPLLNPPYTDAPVRVIMFSSQTGVGRNDLLSILSETLK
ncbi:MAG: YihA family ribosome biogenesis GTP-binding protein [Clostridia bacterium]|nr:YihA family ribosome biogenesis GTP-binding protein [Clostridia bacterium]